MFDTTDEYLKFLILSYDNGFEQRLEAVAYIILYCILKFYIQPLKIIVQKKFKILK